MVGRYSVEKRQDLIIKAIQSSKYEHKIQLILAGKGPWKGYLEEISKTLTNPPVFDFYTEEELIEVINFCDLYVHASDAEIEAISCMEAFTCGLVPVISDSKISATNQFALDELNLFRHGDADSLREKSSIGWNTKKKRRRAVWRISTMPNSIPSMLVSVSWKSIRTGDCR